MNETNFGPGKRGQANCAETAMSNSIPQDYLREHGRRILNSLRAGRGQSVEDIETLPLIYAVGRRVGVGFLWAYAGILAVTTAAVVSVERLFGSEDSYKAAHDRTEKHAGMR